MSTSDNIKFFCPQCEESNGREKKELKMIMDRIEGMEERIMKKMETLINIKVETRVRERKGWRANWPKKLGAISVQEIETKIKVQVEESLEEKKEVEERVNNLIIYNL